MRIAITVDPEIPVPPLHYGGIERIVDLLIRGLIERGHHITLFAHPDSKLPCQLLPYPALRSQARMDLLRNMWHVSSHVLKQRVDIVHSFGRLAYLTPLLPLPLPKLMSYQRHISSRSVQLSSSLARQSLHFTGCSRSLIAAYVNQPNWHVVYNGVPAFKYVYQAVVPPDAPLVFLGRVEEIKGPHIAIEIARLTGRKLIIAGNVPPDAQSQTFFSNRIAPHLNEQRIVYIGPVDDADKNVLLGQAAALLMPVLWDEPFGIVMAEALACGTPILGFPRGAIPEVIQHGINGFLGISAAELAHAVCRLNQISRYNCRRILEEKFSDQAVVDGYERLYIMLNGLYKKLPNAENTTIPS